MGCKKCDSQKPKYRKGLWSPEEDQRLRDYVLKYGHGCWSSVPSRAGLQRNGKSCRLRWINYLRPGLKRGVFTQQEEDTIFTLHGLLGNKWSQMAMHLPGRTDNEIKNHWNSYLKKKVIRAGEGIEPRSSNSSTPSFNSTPRTSPPPASAFFFHNNDPSHQTTIFESFGQSDRPANQIDQSVHQILGNHSFGQAANTNTLPKLIFAEWLSNDNYIDGLCNVESGRGSISCDNSNWYVHEGGPSIGEFTEYKDLHSQFEPVAGGDHLPSSMFFGHSFQDEICSNFTMFGDVMS